MLMPILLALTSAQQEPVATIPNAASLYDCAASEPGIRMTVSGLRDQSGRLKMELYPADESDFLAKDDALLRAGKVFRRVVVAVPPHARDVSLCVNVPRPGRYAVLVIHKRSGNRRFSVDNDGVSLPGSQHIGRRRPPFGQAIVTVSDEVTTVAAPMQYQHGLAGFEKILP